MLLAMLLAVLLDAGCSGPPPTSAPERSEGVEGSPRPAGTPTSRAVPRDPELVVIGHATRPQLDLTFRQLARLAGGRVERWRGLRVLARRPPAAAISAVERDPDALAVVPLDAVRPTVVAHRVGGADPVRDAPGAVTLTVVGDVMLTRGVPDPAAALAPMRDRLRAADVTVGNLESTLSTRGAPTQGGDSFGGSPALVPLLERAGFDALSLANNHSGDYGEQALLDTMATLRRSRVAPFGAGADVAAAARPAYVERDGVRFAFVGFNAIGETPRATATGAGALSLRMPPRTGPLVPADLARVSGVVRAADRRADMVVVLPHWGTQYTHRPEPVQRLVGRRLAAAGADLVVGGHPHWVQGADVLAGVPVVHSLGNFVFDMDFMAQTMVGVVLEATFLGPRLAALRLVPYRMDPASFAPRPLRGPAAAAVLAEVWRWSSGPFDARPQPARR